MAETPARRDQVFESSLLDLVSPTGRPKYQGIYQLSNQLTNTLAHLAGQDGVYSRLLACNSSGVLKVQADSLDAIAEWDFDTLYYMVGDIGLVVCDVHDILMDVWDVFAHAIRTTT
jgi:hypothetical protein